MSDLPTTGSLSEHLIRGLRRTGDAPAMRSKRFGLWRPVSGRALADRAEAVARGLRTLGLAPGDTAAIYGGNCLEWVVADLGILRAGVVSAGLDAFGDAADLARMLAEVRPRMLFVEGEERLRAALAARPACSSLVHIVLLRRDWRDRDAGDAVVTLADVEASSASADDMAGAPNATAVVAYTSGTTGAARAIALPHGTVVAQISRAASALGLGVGDERLSLLPIHHVAERVTGIYAALSAGCVVNFPENAETAPADLAELQPSIVQLSPRNWRAMRSATELTLEDTTPFQRRLARYALQQPNSLSDRLVLKPLRRRLGIDGARLCLSVGAPLQPDVATWFHALGRELHDVYALAETGGAVAITPVRSAPTAPVPLAGIEFTTTADGGISVRAPDLSFSYVGEQGAPRSPGEWFATGDRSGPARVGVSGRLADATMVGSATIPVSDREERLRASRHIADAFITAGDGKSLRAVILLDGEQIAKFAQNAAVPFTHFRSLTEAPEVITLIAEVVADVNRKYPDPPIARFDLIDRALAPGDPAVGPTMALRRYKLLSDAPGHAGQQQQSSQPIHV